MRLKHRDVGAYEVELSYEGQMGRGDPRAVLWCGFASSSRFDADCPQDIVLHLGCAVADALGGRRFSRQQMQPGNQAKGKANPAERAGSAGTGERVFPFRRLGILQARIAQGASRLASVRDSQALRPHQLTRHYREACGRIQEILLRSGQKNLQLSGVHLLGVRPLEATGAFSLFCSCGD